MEERRKKRGRVMARASLMAEEWLEESSDIVMLTETGGFGLGSGMGGGGLVWF